MTKAKAKALVSDLIEAGHAPTIQEDNGDYTVFVKSATGATPTAVNNLANTHAITATVIGVRFS